MKIEMKFSAIRRRTPMGITIWDTTTEEVEGVEQRDGWEYVLVFYMDQMLEEAFPSTERSE